MPADKSLPKSMTCEQVDGLMVAYARGLLPVPEANRVTAHLLHCDRFGRRHWEWLAAALGEGAGEDSAGDGAQQGAC